LVEVENFGYERTEFKILLVNMKIIKVARMGIIFEIASEIRERMMDEYVSELLEEVNEDYDNDDEKRERLDEILSGGKFLSPPFCEMMSEELCAELNKRGFDAKKVCGNCMKSYHCWVELNNKVIIDITADQFGANYPDVFITSYSRSPEYEKRTSYEC